MAHAPGSLQKWVAKGDIVKPIPCPASLQQTTPPFSPNHASQSPPVLPECNIKRRPSRPPIPPPIPATRYQTEHRHRHRNLFFLCCSLVLCPIMPHFVKVSIQLYLYCSVHLPYIRT